VILSIITINYNNIIGLEKTLNSVLSQMSKGFEHIIVDGGSNDGSADIIKAYAEQAPYKVIWVSEPDNGIFNAMNKGIRMASGDYCQFLNSGDCLIDNTVTEKMLYELNRNQPISVIYGNMQKVLPTGKILLDRCCSAGNDVTLNMFYRGCLNHSPAYIRRDLFDRYGYYDETLKICSDWKFYMQSIVLGGESVKHVDIDVTLFDMTGISETQKDLLNEERNRLLKELVPSNILKDYHRYHEPMEQYDRLSRHHLWGLVWFVERVIFKLEKWGIIKK